MKDLQTIPGSTDRIKFAVDNLKESKRKLRSENDLSTVDHVTKFQGRVGNGNLFNFIVSFSSPDTYQIVIVDGFHEGYKFETYALFCNFLKQNQHDPNKEQFHVKTLGLNFTYLFINDLDNFLSKKWPNSNVYI